MHDQTTSPEDRRAAGGPLLVFDGDCGFCRRWILRWKQMTGPRVEYVPYQELGPTFRGVPAKRFEEAVHLFEPDGSVTVGAEAALRALARSRRHRWAAWAYAKVPGFSPAAEAIYRHVARNRRAASRVTRILWGDRLEIPTYSISSGLFLRLIGVIYLIAFVSLRVQVGGLIGSEGILSLKTILGADPASQGVYWTLPLLSWLDMGEATFNYLCTGGIIFSVLLIVGILPFLDLILLWSIYLGLLSVSPPFLNYQWDTLLLEAGLLAIFLSPFNIRQPLLGTFRPSRFVLFLLHLLLFRLLFSSGMVKLLSGDPTWSGLTALRYHFETQPLPTWTSWYFHQLPGWVHTLGALFVLSVELVAPFLIFAPRRPRILAAGCIAALQLLILATGSYGFFNLLTLVLVVLLLDDAAWPRRIRERFLGSSRVERRRRYPFRWSRWIVGPVGAVILILSLVQMSWTLRLTLPWPAPVRTLYGWSLVTHSVNRYGLFAVMTRKRNEIIVEGSNDGETWVPYEFKWKPGDPMRRPRFATPHMPRLDWQMWFAALGNYRQNSWFVYFLFGLLEGSPPVLGLLESNPFPDGPPRYVRATLYEYRFTDFETRRKTGAWWVRKPLRPYCPVLSQEGIEAID